MQSMSKQNLRCVLNLILRSITYTVFCLANSAYAADDYLNMEIEELLQVPVTGATLHDESLKTVPAAVSIFTHDSLEKMGIDYLYELINFVPSYQFNRSGDSGVSYSFGSRGRRNGSQAREVLVLMDGRMLANPRTGSVDISLPFIPLERIERVEVIRGPGSALYGSSAFTGVINIVTRTGQNAAKVELGSDDRRSASLSLTQPLGEWNANVDARVYEDNGQHYWVKDSFTHAPLQTDDPRKTVGLDLSLSREDTRLRFAYDRTNASNFFQIENTQNGFNGFDVSLKQISLEQKLPLIDKVTTLFSVDYLQNEQHLKVAAVGAGALANISQPSSNDPLLSKGLLIGESYNLRLTNDWLAGENATAILGVEWKHEREVDAKTYNNFDLGQLVQGIRPIAYYGDYTHSTALGPRASVRSQGVFTQYQRQLNDATALTLGLRYDDYDNLGKHASPRLALVHQIDSVQTIKLLYGEAYRAPSLSEMGIMNTTLILGNPKLNYEVVKTWDLMWLASWRDTNVSVGGFRNNYQDPIVAGFIGTTRTFVNTSDESSDGVALEATHYFNAQWRVRATYTDFIDLPKTAFREAKHLASFEVNFNEGPWNWNLLGYYQSKRYTLGANNSLHKLDDFLVVNSKLRYSFQEGYNLSLQIKNVADSDFVTPSQGVKMPEGVPNRGREMSLTFDFAL